MFQSMALFAGGVPSEIQGIAQSGALAPANRRRELEAQEDLLEDVASGGREDLLEDVVSGGRDPHQAGDPSCDEPSSVIMGCGTKV